MFDNAIYIVGQALGVVAVILGFISFQMKTSRGILIFQMIVAAVFALHYLLIGAYTAVALNALAAVQNLCYYFRNKKGSTSKLLPILFISLIVISSVLTWTDWRSAIIMVGVVLGSISLALSDAQKIRATMLVKSPVCLVYNALVLSLGGVVYESAVIISSLIGLIKNRNSVSNK